MPIKILPIGPLSLKARGLRAKQPMTAIPSMGRAGRTEQRFTLVPGVPFLYTAANWGAVSWFFEAYFRSTSAKALARLFDTTIGAEVAGSVLTLDAVPTMTRVRSPVLTLTDGHEYVAQFGTQDAGAGAMLGAHLIAV